MSSNMTPLTDIPITVIRPSRGWVSLQLDEVWKYRELLYFFIWRDIKVRYKQTILGAAWAIIVPFMNMVVFSLFFGKLANIPSDGIPYPLWSFAALVPWQFFTSGISTSSSSLVTSSNMIKKIYFPRLILPITAALSGIVDFVLAFLVLILMIVGYDVLNVEGFSLNLTSNVLWLPLFLLLAIVTAMGVGLWLSAMNVQFRDVRYVVPFLTQLWLFATPITYPSSLIPEPWRVLYGLNPMAGVVEGFRWALLNTDSTPGPILVASVVASIILLISGAYYFRRMEKTFADVA
ncbi:MAG: ABC transporter permease [Ardenticatenaceae bacterium]|nr:ABC transporter permease [Ardenticatenaceae bacterium]MCB8950106.1 ABC transporter permease [Ardenticatenaceae bacterium]